MDEERSFISLGATLVPCSVLLNYYLDGDKSFVNDIHDYNYPQYNDYAFRSILQKRANGLLKTSSLKPLMRKSRCI